MKFLDNIFSGWDFLDEALNSAIIHYIYGDSFSTELPNTQLNNLYLIKSNEKEFYNFLNQIQAYQNDRQNPTP